MMELCRAWFSMAELATLVQEYIYTKIWESRMYASHVSMYMYTSWTSTINAVFENKLMVCTQWVQIRNVSFLILIYIFMCYYTRGVTWIIYKIQIVYQSKTMNVTQIKMLFVSIWCGKLYCKNITVLYRYNEGASSNICSNNYLP